MNCGEKKSREKSNCKSLSTYKVMCNACLLPSLSLFLDGSLSCWAHEVTNKVFSDYFLHVNNKEEKKATLSSSFTSKLLSQMTFHCSDVGCHCNWCIYVGWWCERKCRVSNGNVNRIVHCSLHFIVHFKWASKKWKFSIELFPFGSIPIDKLTFIGRNCTLANEDERWP